METYLGTVVWSKPLVKFTIQVVDYLQSCSEKKNIRTSIAEYMAICCMFGNCFCVLLWAGICCVTSFRCWKARQTRRWNTLCKRWRSGHRAIVLPLYEEQHDNNLFSLDIDTKLSIYIRLNEFQNCLLTGKQLISSQWLYSMFTNLLQLSKSIVCN